MIEEEKAIGFAIHMARLVLNNGGIIPSNLEKMFKDWDKKAIKVYNPSSLLKMDITPKNKENGECIYIHQRKADKGKACGVVTKNGNEYCPKHLAYVKLKEKKGLL